MIAQGGFSHEVKDNRSGPVRTRTRARAGFNGWRLPVCSFGGGIVTDLERYKREAALRALALVEDGMLLGLGTGTTAHWFVVELGARLNSGALNGVRGVAASAATAEQAKALGIELVALPATGVDLAVDGMDELTPDLSAIKGLGGALAREKVVAAAAARFVLIGDSTKLVDHLGQKAPLPVEVLRFGHERSAWLLSELGCEPRLRRSGSEPFVTDNGNLIYDCHFSHAFDAAAVAAELAELPGIVEHGLFLNMCERAFVAGDVGVTELTPR